MIHPYSGASFGPGGVGTGSFTGVRSVAVDQSSGTVYVYDAGAEAVYKFDAGGTPVNFSALTGNAITGVGGGGGGAEYEIAVAPAGSPGGSAGNIYVANNSQSLQVYAPSGTKLGEVAGNGETCGVATDAAGHVFLGVYSETVREFTPSASSPSSWPETGTSSAPLPGICNVAADGLGNVYAANFSGGQGIVKLEGIDDSTATPVDPHANTLAIDPSNNDLYGDNGSSVTLYSTSGTSVGSVEAGRLSGSRGVSVNGVSGAIYAGNGSKVDVFSGTGILVPNATTKDATQVGPVSATLNGEIGADGGPSASCEFQFVTQAHYAAEQFTNPTAVACDPPGPFTGAGENAVSATISGLTAEGSYRFRVVGSSTNGKNIGEALSLNTSPAVTLETQAATAVTGTSARLNGTITPEGSEVEECVFEYGLDYTLGKTVPCVESAAEIGTGTQPKAVHADLSNLNLGTGYVFKLRAKNHFGTSKGFEEYFSTPGPRIAEENARPGDTTAILTGLINPEGEEVNYGFEYVTDAEFTLSGYTNATRVPGDKAIPAGEEDVKVSQEVGGLAPQTLYHFRITTSSTTGEGLGQDVKFKTFRSASAALPDGRVYEQATPPVEKNGNNLIGNPYNVLRSSPNGDATTYTTGAGAGDTDSGQSLPIYIARRGVGNWYSEGINPPATIGSRLRNLTYKRDLSGAYAIGWNPREPGSLYLREQGGRLVTIATGIASSAEIPASERTNVDTESSDGSLVLFESPAKLTGNAIDGKPNAYIWNRETGEVKLVSVLPDGSTPPGGGFPGAYQWLNFTEPTQGGAEASSYVADTLSQDGSRAFFTTSGVDQVYVRLNPSSPSATTVHVSASQKTNGAGPGGTDPNGPAPAAYLGATPDGAYVFFKSSEELTNDANTGNSDQGEDIYRYDVATGALIDLAPGTVDANGAQVQGLAGISDDGSYAYFVARGKLADGATSGVSNLYVWHDGTVDFISALDGNFDSDGLVWLPSKLTGNHVTGEKTSRVTADGRTLVFQSLAPHPGFANNGMPEIYRYEYGQAEPLCISCNPSRSSTEGGGAFLQHYEAFFVAAQTETSFYTRNLSADGKRMFFQTDEKLVSRDVNGVSDVYEWEASGSGSCKGTEENGGCLFLISTGTSPNPSYFSDSSVSGDDVFFFTTQQLVGQDRDDLRDVYDARVNGGLAAQNPPPPNPCSGEACLGSGGAPPGAQSPGTATFSGPNSPKPHHAKQHRKKHRKQQKKKQKKQSKAGHRQGGGHR